MIKTITLLGLFTGAALMSAAQIDFTYGGWGDILDSAKKQNKRIMVDAYTDWCTWCKVMDRNTFSDEQVADYTNKNFVAWKLDMEEGFGIDMAMKYRVMSYPTILFFNSNGELVHKSLGFEKPETFLATVHKADSAQVLSPQVNPTDFDPGYPDFYKNSFKKEKEEARQWPTPDQLQAYMSNRQDLTDEVSWAVMTRFTMPDKYEQYFLSNQQEYSGKYGDGEVRRVVQKLVYDRLKSAMKNQNPQKLKEANLMVDAYLEKDKEFQKLSNKLLYNQRVQDWDAYMNAAREIMNMDKEIDPGAVNSIAWTIYKKVPGKVKSQTAIEWMEPVVEANEHYAYWDTYAWLLFKVGRLKDAKQAAQNAVDIGKQHEEDVSATQNLLDKIAASQ